MITNVTSLDLEKQIEQLVREHIAVTRKVATAALERAFAKADGESAQQSRRPKRIKQRLRRRASDQVAALSERFYVAVCEKPGETMMVLARQLGMTSQELSVPVVRLKRADLVRTVGQRSHTKYFPMASDAKADKGAKA